MLFASGVLTYFGPFNWISRNRLRKNWVEEFKNQGLATREFPKISEILGEPEKLSQQHNKNLLRDEVSIENILIMEYSPRWPLWIDPEDAAYKWAVNKNDLYDSQQNFTEELKNRIAQNKYLTIHINKE